MSFSHEMNYDYETLIWRMNPPRVVIDNEACENATVIRVVGSASKHGIHLEVVQLLTDLNLIFTKAYISSDGGWFMDVFNVTDQDGNKVRDEEVLDYIQKSLGPDACFASSMRSDVVEQSMDSTVIELTGSDRSGLLSEVSAVLTNLKCSVVSAGVWTHDKRAASVMHVTDEETGLAITDPQRLAKIKELLCNVLKGSNNARGARTVVSHAAAHTDRRLHQMMSADMDYERFDGGVLDDKQRPDVSVVNWHDKDYSMVTIRSKDRPKLFFDTIFTLTDMQYVVFHASIDTEGPEAYQEYYIRHVDGSPVQSDTERQRVIQCLEAAIERRVSEGLKLELCTTDRVGLLSYVTRIFREYSLAVTRAEVATKAGKAAYTFYVRDASGSPVDSKTIKSIQQEIGQTILKVTGNPEGTKPGFEESPTSFLFGGLLKSRSFVNFKLINKVPLWLFLFSGLIIDLKFRNTKATIIEGKAIEV